MRAGHQRVRLLEADLLVEPGGGRVEIDCEQALQVARGQADPAGQVRQAQRHLDILLHQLNDFLKPLLEQICVVAHALGLRMGKPANVLDDQQAGDFGALPAFQMIRQNADDGFNGVAFARTGDDATVFPGQAVGKRRRVADFAQQTGVAPMRGRGAVFEVGGLDIFAGRVGEQQHPPLKFLHGPEPAQPALMPVAGTGNHDQAIAEELITDGWLRTCDHVRPAVDETRRVRCQLPGKPVPIQDVIGRSEDGQDGRQLQVGKAGLNEDFKRELVILFFGVSQRLAL